ncbi:MAG: hypothetical protein K1W36_09080 [Lachnospiraceae bacterium]|jgi:hypothetical protein|nr:hypothetical protein [Lachnospiraceae bacterium]
MISSEDVMIIVKNTIAASIKCNTYRGYIGWSSCDNICADMHDCVDMCAEQLKSGDALTALKASVYILLSGVKLASYADSSSGMLTDVILCTYDLIGKCTKEIEKQDKKMRNEALDIIIKEARKNAFDGWTDWRYDLLKCGICLCDEKNAQKLEKVFDILLERAQEDSFPDYTKKEDMITRYLLHRHLYGKETVREELYQNISVKELRRIAISDALEEGQYGEAEQLCLEQANEESAWHYRSSDPEDWNNILYDIYVAANDTEKQIAQAKKLLLMGNEKFWEVLKQIYSQNNAWNEHYESLLNLLKNAKQAICYRNVLIAEKETKRLLEDVTENPFDLFYYGKYLVKDYPEQVYELCYEEISRNCAQAKDRREYKKVTKQIAQLIKWKGTDKAGELIEELRRTYPRRTALLDELGKVEKKL